jgi:phosphatidylglycerophosphate synthase
MFDAKIRPLIDPVLNAQGARLAARGIRPDQVTLAGLGFGLLAAVLVGLGIMGWALAAILLSRLLDGLDGAVARAGQPSAFGGYLDIVCDFAFYGAIPVAFVILDPSNGLAAAFLLFSFYVNGATFLGYAVLAEKREMKTEERGVKTLYFTGGLLEGAETIALFVLFCLIPSWFVPVAFVFGGLCMVTAVSRVLLAARVFKGRS